MSNWQSASPQFVLPRPGRALIGVMAALFFIWLMFAIAVNWGGASSELFLLFCGNDAAIFNGEVWRLFTAPLMHHPSGQVGHILFVLLGLYFLTPSLEQQWGGARLLRFLAGSAVLAYAFQMLLGLFLPATAAAKLIPPYWYGAFPVIEAVAIAWALSFKGQQVRLMFVLPVTSRGLVLFVVGISVLRVIALSQGAPGGLLSPFGGMIAGWLLGGGTPSPLRRFYLKFKLQQMEREVEKEKKARRSRVNKSGFDVIEGGRSKKKPPPRGPDGNYLN